MGSFFYGPHVPLKPLATPRCLDLAILLAIAVLLANLFVHLSHPLIWSDEGDSVMFGQRVLEYGYPKVHGERNLLYGLKEKLEVGIDETTDAYTGAPWMNYYVAAAGVYWASHSTDDYAKTLRLRLPFTLVGLLGLALLFVSVAPALSEFDVVAHAQEQRGYYSTRSALLVFAILACLSTSLILHLREARYYPIVLLLVGSFFFVWLRHHVFGRASYAGYCVGTFLSLFLLFNTFYPAFGVVVVSSLLHLATKLRLARAERRTSLQDFSWSAMPVFAALFAVLPLLAFFDFVEQSERWFESFDSSFRAYLQNLAVVGYNLMRFEFLLLVLVLKVLLLSQRAGVRALLESGEIRQRLDVSRFLGLFLLAYFLLVTRSPFIFERYFLAMGPVLSLLVIVDGSILLSVVRFGSRLSDRKWRQRIIPAVVLATFAVTVGVRYPELQGRIQEMRVPYQGPLDFAIPYLKKTYQNPEDLVIATNYAGSVFMYYLGSHVTIGYYGANLEQDMAIQPDIIIPRPWSRQRAHLATLSASADYRRKEFPVADQATNNIPSLSPFTPGGLRHRYETVFAQDPLQRFAIYERVNEDG